jgi:glycosyltransferase involved in cell wall biosynthesis
VKPRLLFVSPRYLLPADSGGKIRTRHVLRGLKDGRFHVTLLSPAPRNVPAEHSAELALLCDEFRSWPEVRRGPWFSYVRLRHLASRLPVSIATDRSAAAQGAISEALSRGVDIMVVDFLHAAILIPNSVHTPCIVFTHNVEAEIFARHAQIERNWLRKVVWREQLQKMTHYERAALARFNYVVAVSERDRDHFQKNYGVKSSTIPTGVDLDYFTYHPPGPLANPESPTIVFTASMDSLANIDGVSWFIEAVWPLVAREYPKARMSVVGRNPDPELVREAKRRNLNWHFTGYVDDIRPYLESAAVYVIPLRVGGGTRIKAYEAMAFGLPVVSTAVGIEGLGVEPDKHYLEADTPEEFAGAVLNLLGDEALRRRIAAEARKLIEGNFSARSVGRAFEEICVNAIKTHSPR